MTCNCQNPHYPLRFFGRSGDTHVIATRGVRPVENTLRDGWDEIVPPMSVINALHYQYNQSHRFDWLHTPTYLDDRETHLRMKASTAR